MEKDISGEIIKIFPRLMRAVSKESSDELIRGEITIPQMILLQILLEKNMCTMSNIAKDMGITTSAVTGLTDRLIRSKLITRTRGIKDRRIVIVSLTEKGKDLIKRIFNQRQQMMRRVLSVLTPKEREIYLSLIKKIYNRLIKKE